MSTRSYVGIIENGKVTYGYHHCDSHLESLGIDLFESIKTKKDAYDLLENFAELNMGRVVPRDNFFRITKDDIFIEFCYAFDVKENQWYVSSSHFADTNEHKLIDVVQDDKQMNAYLDMYYEDIRDGILETIRENIRRKNKSIKICNLQVDVELNDDGNFELWISNEGNSGCHYTLERKDIGRFVTDEIDMYIDEALTEG